MFPRCPNCGQLPGRYDEPENTPCHNCGNTLLWFTHAGSSLGFPFGIQTHEVLIDVSTGKVLSPDPCDNIEKLREWAKRLEGL